MEAERRNFCNSVSARISFTYQPFSTCDAILPPVRTSQDLTLLHKAFAIGYLSAFPGEDDTPQLLSVTSLRISHINASFLSRVEAERMVKCTICQRSCDQYFSARLGDRWAPVCKKCARKLKSQGHLVTGLIKPNGGILTDKEVAEAIVNLQKLGKS